MSEKLCIHFAILFPKGEEVSGKCKRTSALSHVPMSTAGMAGRFKTLGEVLICRSY